MKNSLTERYVNQVETKLCLWYFAKKIEIELFGNYKELFWKRKFPLKTSEYASWTETRGQNVNIQGPPLGIDIMYLVLADRSMQV